MKDNACRELVANTLEVFLRHVLTLRDEWMGEDEAVLPWFRGQARADWALKPKFFRDGPASRNTEDEIREEFVTRAPTLVAELMPTNDWDWYFLMQHYGAPTRLLDWTEGALLGLYFAVRDNCGYHDAAVWALDPWWLNKKVIGRDEVLLPGGPGALKEDTRRVHAWLPERFDTRARLPSRPVAIYPSHNVRRIGAQRSCFTISGEDHEGLDKLARLKDSHLVKILIPSFEVKGIGRALETCGIDEPTVFPDLDGLSRSLGSKWKPRKSSLPHQGVWTRLRPSKLHGVGVFAIRKIKKGTLLFPGDCGEMVWVQKNGLPRISKEVQRLYRDFAVLRGGRYGCPPTFNRLSTSWYLNESANPNVRCNSTYDFIALKDIKAGEELTVDYSTYSD